MPRPPSSSNVHLGLFLGIAAASVVLALTGCALPAGGSGQSAAPGSGLEPRHAEVDLAQFSADEQQRILAVQALVARAAGERTLDPSLLNGMIWVESRFDPRAKSPAGARGLMQLMPATAAYLAKRLGINSARSYDPEFNVRAGALYLAQMIERFGNERYAIAAYHAGPGNVKKWLEAGEAFPDYSQAYVAKVMAARERFRKVSTHGARSNERLLAAASTPTLAELNADEMTVPDVDTLPDAADIHGMPRVLAPVPAPRPAAVWREETAPKNPQPERFEVVFEPHPELDHGAARPASGWATRDTARRPHAQTRARPRPTPVPVTQAKRGPKPKPKPKPKPEPETAPDEVIGIGVLPDL